MKPAAPEEPLSENSGDARESDSHRKPIFYGWWIVAASTVASAVQSAIFNIGASVLFLPIAREFGTTRTVVAGAFSLSRLEGGITGPLEGFLIHWVGPRKYMAVGWVLFGLGLVGVGLSRSIVEFYITFLIVTLGQSMAGFLPIVTVLVNWFRRWRGRAISFYQVGSSIGALTVPGVAWLILNVGWREATIGIGIATIFIGIPLASVMRQRPEDYGLQPDGDENRVSQDEHQTLTAVQDGPSPTIFQALKSRNFWLLGAANSIALTSWGALRVHQIPALVDIGLTEQTAANVLSFSFIIAAGGRLAGGFLGDLVGTKPILIIALLMQGVAVIILAFASSMTQVMIFSVIFGISFGARGTLMTSLRGEVFGRKNFSRLAGLMDPMSTIGVVIAPLFAGFAYDMFGNYRLAFLTTAVLTMSGVLLLLGIKTSPEQVTASERPKESS